MIATKDPLSFEPLQRAGIEVAVLDENGDHAIVREQCLRAAQQIRRRGCRSIGLLPASAEVGVVGIGVNLAIAMAELTGATIAYVDANMRWPALSSLPAPEDEAEAETGAGADAHPFATRWFRGDVALLVPKGRNVTSAGALTTMLHASAFACSIVDLTGWRRTGEHLTAYELLDGIAIVAEAGVTTEDQLLRLGHEVPRSKELGVLLIGARE